MIQRRNARLKRRALLDVRRRSREVDLRIGSNDSLIANGIVKDTIYSPNFLHQRNIKDALIVRTIETRSHQVLASAGFQILVNEIL